ncbi:hypothetical protein OH77DRAFT_1541470 [Trametes cingulata]|nr:hypothetical protein OH77DRAFT_1541470 [Trametes cingulata]
MSAPQRNSAPSTPTMGWQNNRFAILENEDANALAVQSVPSTPPPAYDQLFVSSTPATVPVFGASSFPPLPSSTGQIPLVQEERSTRLREQMEALAARNSVLSETNNANAEAAPITPAAAVADGPGVPFSAATPEASTAATVAVAEEIAMPTSSLATQTGMQATTAAAQTSPEVQHPVSGRENPDRPPSAASRTSSAMYWSDTEFVPPPEDDAQDDRMDEDPAAPAPLPPAQASLTQPSTGATPFRAESQAQPDRPRKGKKRARLESLSPSPSQRAPTPAEVQTVAVASPSIVPAPAQHSAGRRPAQGLHWPEEAPSVLPAIGVAGPSVYRGALSSRLPPPQTSLFAAPRRTTEGRRGILEADTLRYGEPRHGHGPPGQRGAQQEDAMNVDGPGSTTRGAPPPDLEDLYGEVSPLFREETARHVRQEEDAQTGNQRSPAALAARERRTTDIRRVADQQARAGAGESWSPSSHELYPGDMLSRTYAGQPARSLSNDPPRPAGSPMSRGPQPPVTEDVLHRPHQLSDFARSGGTVYSAAMLDEEPESATQGGLPPIPHIFTQPPADGFPRTNFNDPEALRAGISAGRLTTLNEQEEGTYAFLQIYNVAIARGPNIRLLADSLSNAITAITGVFEPLIIPPEPDWSAPAARRLTPRTWIVLRLTPEGVDRLVERAVWSSVEITFFAYRTEPAIPRYLFSLSGFTHDWDRDVFRTVQRVFNTSTVRASIAELVQSNPNFAQERPADATTRILRSLVVVVNSLNSNMLMAAIYMDSPTTSMQSWRDWRDRLARLPYQTTYNNMGVHRRFAPTSRVGTRRERVPRTLTSPPRMHRNIMISYPLRQREEPPPRARVVVKAEEFSTPVDEVEAPTEWVVEAQLTTTASLSALALATMIDTTRTSIREV